MQSVRVKIQGREYTLRSEQSPEQVQRVAEFVEQLLAETAAGRPVDTRDLTVFALLNLAGQHLQLQDGQEQQQREQEKKLKNLLERLERADSGC
jgi:cell division protein ZapA